MKLLFFLLGFFLYLNITVQGKTPKEKPSFHLNGALRFNYNLSDWSRGQRKRGGDFSYDVFFLHPTASYKKFLLDADVRFYSTASGGFMIKYGWIGYRFNARNHLEIGLTKVPFGIQPFYDQSFFFQIAYYIGLQEDADIGIKFVHQGPRWEYALAFFKNADELLWGAKNKTSDDRYGYDVAGQNKETNQVNVQLIYKFGEIFKQKAGFSAELGQLYNLATRNNGSHFAFAAHYELHWKAFQMKALIGTYAMYPKNIAGESRDLVTMTAYGAPYVVAAKANIYTLSFGHTFHIKTKWLQTIQFYHDFGLLQKWKKLFRNSNQNITGCLFMMGAVCTSVDYAMGKHHAWLGPDWDAFGPGWGSNSWHARFNINVGYYF